GYGGLAFLTLCCAWLMWRARPAAVRVGALPETEGEERRTQPVTWLRRLRWVALAVVPSSLMLGVTTYITTDIAAIPLLWVLPLTLYLLTFILVFARISPRAQPLITLAALGTLRIAIVVWAVPTFLKDDS